MKKFVCLLLCVMLTMAATTAMAKIEYTLLEKWQRQVDFGNGIKGTLQVDASGEAQWAKLLEPLNGHAMEIRAIHDGDAFQYRLYVPQGEELRGLTQLYGDAQAVYLQSDLLPDTILTLPTGGDVVNRLAGVGAEDSPSLYSAMLNILNVPQTTWENKWQPALEAYETAIELWLDSYASAPSVLRSGEGSASVLLRYDIPADALKTQIKALWGNVLQDAVLLPLLQGEMNEAQRQAYLNTNLKYYYDQVIDGLQLEDSIILEREMTAQGEALRTEMMFPLDMDAWHSVKLTKAGSSFTFDLQGKEKQLVLEVTEGENGSHQGRARYIPADKSKKAAALTFALTETKATSIDEDTRSHDITSWTLSLKPDEEFSGEGWEVIAPVELTLQTHLHSKSQQNNPVTMEVNLSAKWEDAQLTAALKLITRSKWVMDQLPTEGAVDISALPAEERTRKLTDIALNGLAMLQRINQENTIPVPEAQGTDAPDQGGETQP